MICPYPLFCMAETLKIKIIQPDLISQFGALYDAPVTWAMDKIAKGHAVVYQPEFKSPPQPVQPLTINNPPLPKQAPTRDRAKPEILWVQDSNIMGGAELSSQLVMDVGIKLGFNIQVLTPQNFDLWILRNAKLIILNNIWTFSDSQMIELKRTICEFQRPYIKYEHDMRELYDERLNFSRRLFKHSKMNVFISPGQLQRYEEKIYEMSENVTLPLAINIDLFKPNPKIKRNMKKVVHTSGNLHNKGCQILLSMVQKHPDLCFDIFAGENRQIEQMFAQHKNVTLKQRVPNDKMPDVYSEAGYLAHVPTGYWAGERVVLEAALCGCKLKINDNVGHKSWGWDLSDVDSLRERLLKAPYDFWKAVEEKV